MPSLSKPTTERSHSVASKQLVVRGILRGLMEGRWQGGDRFTEASAVAEFGVSRTPVREALLELQGLGLIELRRNCGAVALPFGTPELSDLYAVRSLLEVEACRLAAGSVDPGEVERLRKAFVEICKSNQTDPDWQLDRDLHNLIARSSGNRRLLAEISRYGDLVQAMREIVGEHSLGIHSTSAEEHLAILEALREQKPGKAADRMNQHMEQASRSAIAAVQKIRSSS